MATIIVEDGTGKTDANSYASEAELTTYAADRGITITGTNNQLLILAMDYIESQNFKGTKNTKAQALQWPRYGVYIDNYHVDNDEIPVLLKEAQMEAALSIDASVDPLANIERSVKKEKLDTLEVEYMDNANETTIIRKITNKLRKLIKTAPGLTLRI